MAVTSREDFRRPFAPWLNPHVRRLPYGADPGQVDAALAGSADRRPPAQRRAAGALHRRADRRPRGCTPAAPAWLGSVAAACRRYRVPLIADEIFTGFGRTGRLFAVEHENVRPDLLVCGKALGGGLPIAAVLGRRSLLAAWTTPGEALHTATFVANPPACAAALAVLDELTTHRLPARAARLGTTLGARLATWPDRFPAVVSTRGRGLLWGIELTTTTTAHHLVAEARRRGVLVLAGGPEGRVAQIVPPLTITERQLDTALTILESALADGAC